MLSERELLGLDLELHEANQSLRIADASEKHEGHYTCVVSNSAGSSEETFFVQVLSKFSYFVFCGFGLLASIICL